MFKSNEMKTPYLILFVLLVCYIASIASHPNFDHFWLVQSWPPGYCQENRCNKTPIAFVLHGLWPVDSNGQTLSNYGVADANLKQDPSLGKNMEKYWPSLAVQSKAGREGFWRHQWKEHGTGQSRYLASDYFRLAVRLMKNMDGLVLNALKVKGIQPNGSTYLKTDYIKAIKTVTRDKDPLLFCFRKNQADHHLKEVIICIDDQGRSFISCLGRLEKIQDRCKPNIRFPFQA
ncbi:extracellular ribonuclease LE isoform X2 [Citrus clementina]|uniref:extracellular ribonuclease LE isoform X2 n=1 Tax=Citrus clementina TaxID=85681 RepID=UPI000CECFF30|nr:extracellular ribonuclease LE isoform X2 [Citrus x clementina]